MRAFAYINFIIILMSMLMSSCGQNSQGDEEMTDANTYAVLDSRITQNKYNANLMPRTIGLFLGDCKLELVYVPGGVLDSDEGKKSDEVPVYPYYIGKTEVTQSLWMEVMGYNPSIFRDDDYPVENVTYDEVVAFLQKINHQLRDYGHFRLPNDNEWIFAANGGKRRSSTIYSGSDEFWEVAWIYENSSDHTHRVAQKLPNELGIYDMTGNVAEWCSDIFYDVEDLVNENQGFHLYRGATWSSISSDAGIETKSRKNLYPRSSQVGFRIVMDCE